MTRCTGYFIAIFFLLSASFTTQLLADITTDELYHIRTLETDDFFDGVNLNGIVFPPYADTLLTLNKSESGASVLEQITSVRNPGNPENRLWQMAEPLNITYDSDSGTLLLFSKSAGNTFIEKSDKNNQIFQTIERVNSKKFGIEKPVGAAFDPRTGALFILDQIGPRIVRINPDPLAGTAEASLLGKGQVLKYLVTVDEQEDLKGLAIHPLNGQLYTVNTSTRQLNIIDNNGELVHAGDFPDSHPFLPEALVFAPSLDQTDDPARIHLFIASVGGRSGQVNEWSLTSPFF